MTNKITKKEKTYNDALDEVIEFSEGLIDGMPSGDSHRNFIYAHGIYTIITDCERLKKEQPKNEKTRKPKHDRSR